MNFRLSPEHAGEFIEALCRGRVVYAHVEDKDQYHLVQTPSWNPGVHTLGAYRPVEPLKSIVFRPREMLGAIGEETESDELPEQIVLGVKNCDLSALQIQDYVFLETEPVDPFYKEARDKTVLVSCDCTDCRESCFCPVLGEQPFAKGGYDINISPLPNGWVIETGTERGEAMLEPVRSLLEEADDGILRDREEMRSAMTRCVTDQAGERGLRPGLDLQGAIRESAGAEWWGEFAEDCVECGACNFCCCTCHCFLLVDGHSPDSSCRRIKQWDSCLYRNFARVAGGANPRGHRAERLHNRFDKKFNFFPMVLGRYACDGCGRCIEACAGEIDIRDVLRKALG